MSFKFCFHLTKSFPLIKHINKIRDKCLLYILRALYGEAVDFSCGFYGPDHECRSEVVDSLSVGIVFQGPILNEKKLIEGLRHYRRLFPESFIVISTWLGSINTQMREQLNVLNIHAVESSLPTVSGIMNVNRQIVSTARGVEKILSLTAPVLIMKVRTDYFPWRPDKAVSTLIAYEGLLSGTPRIWGLDLNTRLDLPFSVADIFQIGQVAPMRAYWTEQNLYPTDVTVEQFFDQTNHQTDMAAVLNLQPAEIYLASRYLKAMGCAYDYTSLFDYHAALGEWFGILDAQYLEFGFSKYTFMRPGYEPVANRSKKYVNAQDWIAMLKVKA